MADLIQIETDPATAAAVLDRVPLWFHTFSLDRSTELYTHGVARDHRYRVPALPENFGGMSVLDIGTFDGFYAFLAEARGAERVVAVDNEQYREWVSSRWGVELQGGEGFAAIRELLDSEVDYQHIDAFDLDELEETFDFIFCFGILHRVENPLGLLKDHSTTPRDRRTGAARDPRGGGSDFGFRGRSHPRTGRGLCP